MTEREEFEKWAANDGYRLDWAADHYKYSLTQQAWNYWQLRQPEIDALKSNMLRYQAAMAEHEPALRAWGETQMELGDCKIECDRIKAENERARMDMQSRGTDDELVDALMKSQAEIESLRLEISGLRNRFDVKMNRSSVIPNVD